MTSDGAADSGRRPTPPVEKYGHVAWVLGAVALFSAATAVVFEELLQSDLSVYAPIHSASRPADLFSVTDQKLSIWAIARNARSLVTRPSALLDAEQCFPTPNAHGLNHHFLTLGVVAVPLQLLTTDPVTIHNVVLLTLSVISPLAMFLLVREWTKVPVAGVVAGLIYGFHPMRIGSPVQPDNFDTVWTVLALLFARRLFARGRWLDALGLAVACSLQVGTSPYPMIAAVVIALPVGIWLLASYRWTALRPLPIAVVIAMIAAAAYLVLSPVLEFAAGGAVFARKVVFFLDWRTMLPGTYFFPGWAYLALSAVGLVLGSKRASPGVQGDPRWALLLALVILWALATGGRPFLAPKWNPFLWLAQWIPGLSYIRAPSYLVYTGGHVVMSLLAGLGAAVLVARAQGWTARALMAALLVVTCVDVLRPAVLDLEPRMRFTLIRQRPDAAHLQFFRELESRGNRGPILEVPVMADTSLVLPLRASYELLVSAYHRRPTSECYASFFPPSREMIKAIGKDLPAIRALRAASDLGFTTIVVHAPTRNAIRPKLLRQFDAVVARQGGLQKLHEIDGLTAYALVPERLVPKRMLRARRPPAP